MEQKASLAKPVNFAEWVKTTSSRPRTVNLEGHDLDQLMAESIEHANQYMNSYQNEGKKDLVVIDIDHLLLVAPPPAKMDLSWTSSITARYVDQILDNEEQIPDKAALSPGKNAQAIPGGDTHVKGSGTSTHQQLDAGPQLQPATPSQKKVEGSNYSKEENTVFMTRQRVNPFDPNSPRILIHSRLGLIPDGTSYRYLPLQKPKETRLLGTHARKEGEPLQSQLFIYDLESPVRYDALSYVWGDSRKKEDEIICNGAVIRITRNLGNALKQISLGLGSGGMLLFVDALCINQDDNAEKSHQVRLMETIYRRAFGVCAWLGVPDKDTEISLATIEELAADASNYHGERKHILNDKKMEALRTFFNNPFFDRIWIVQEIGLSSYGTLAAIGKNKIAWEDIGMAAAKVLDRLPIHVEPVLHGMMQAMLMHNLFRTRKEFQAMSLAWRGYIIPSFNLHPFQHLLETSRTFNATDPCDKVYALLGHPDARKADGELMVEPDYQKSALEVFKETALSIIEQSSKLDILSSAGWTSILSEIDEKVERWPSWIPDWSVRLRQCVFAGDFSASGQSDSQVEIFQRTNCLSVRGFSFDVIEMTTDIISAPEPEIDGHCISIPFELLTSDHEATYPTGEEIKMAFYLTMTGGRTFVDELTRFKDGCEDFVRRAGKSDEKTAEDIPKPLGMKTPDWMNISVAVTQVCKLRTFFRSKKGYIGLGPCTTKEGDMICIFFGASVPYILRPCEKGYTLIGECYVHGIMHGQAMEQWRNEGSESSKFDIY